MLKLTAQLLVVIVTVLFIFAGCAHEKGAVTAEKEIPPPSTAPLSIAVNNVIASGVEDGTAAVITNKICTLLSERKNFTVKCANDEATVMNMKAQAIMLGAEDNPPAGAADAVDGAKKDCDRVVEGNIGKVGEQYVLSLKVTGVKDGKVLAREEISAQGDPAGILPQLDDSLKRLLP